MKKIEMSEMQQIQGGKFWGPTVTSCNCQLNYCNVCYDQYAFWINMGNNCVAGPTCNPRDAF